MLRHKLFSLIGLWLIFTGIFGNLQFPENQIICGIILCLAGFTTAKNWADLINGLIGAVLILCFFCLDVINPIFFSIMGILILLANARFIRISHHAKV